MDPLFREPPSGPIMKYPPAFVGQAILVQPDGTLKPGGGGGPGGATFSDIFFVDAQSSIPAGNGSILTPFKLLASALAASAPNQVIYCTPEGYNAEGVLSTIPNAVALVGMGASGPNGFSLQGISSTHNLFLQNVTVSNAIPSNSSLSVVDSTIFGITGTGSTLRLTRVTNVGSIAGGTLVADDCTIVGSITLSGTAASFTNTVFFSAPVITFSGLAGTVKFDEQSLENFVAGGGTIVNGTIVTNTFNTVWFGPGLGGTTDDGVALQALVNSEASGRRRTIRFLPSNYYFSSYVDLPPGKTTMVGPGPGWTITASYPGMVQPLDAWLRFLNYGGSAGWLATQPHTTLINSVAKGDRTITVAGDVAGAIKAGAWMLIGHYPTQVVDVAPSGGNKLVTLWRPSRSVFDKDDPYNVVTPIDPAQAMSTLDFGVNGTMLTVPPTRSQRIFSLSRSFYSNIRNGVLKDDHLPQHVGSWDNCCVGCEVSDFTAQITRYPSEMSLGFWCCEGGDDCTAHDLQLDGLNLVGYWQGENCGIYKSTISLNKDGIGVVLTSGQGFDSQSCFVGNTRISGGKTAVSFTSNNGDVSRDPYTTPDCVFYEQTDAPILVAPQESFPSGGIFRPLVQGRIEALANIAFGLIRGANDLDFYESEFQVANLEAVCNSLGLYNLSYGVAPKYMRNVSITNISSFIGDTGNVARVHRWNDLRAKFTVANVYTLFSTLGGVSARRYVVDGFDVVGAAGLVASLSNSAVLEIIRGNCPSVTGLGQPANTGGTFRLRDTITMPTSKAAAAVLNVGTVILNGVTPVAYSFPDLKDTDNITVTVKTDGGTPGAAPRVKSIPGTGLSITGTALDTSTLQVAIGA